MTRVSVALFKGLLLAELAGSERNLTSDLCNWLRTTLAVAVTVSMNSREKLKSTGVMNKALNITYLNYLSVWISKLSEMKC